MVLSRQLQAGPGVESLMAPKVGKHGEARSRWWSIGYVRVISGYHTRASQVLHGIPEKFLTRRIILGYQELIFFFGEIENLFKFSSRY